MRAALRDHAKRTIDGWVRGVGYFETIAGPLDRDLLDELLPATPLRIQHRSGTAWFCNSAALRRLGIAGPSPSVPEGVELGIDGRATGRLFRLDGWLAERVPQRTPDLAAIGRELAGYGVTALTDATPFKRLGEIATLVDAATDGTIPQRLQLMTGCDVPNESLGGVRLSCVKLMLDERDPPSLESLSIAISAAHHADRSVAIHLTDRSTTWLALSAWSDVGVRPGDRVEHGSVLDDDAVQRCAELGLIVVTNPALATSRGDDHARDTDPDDREYLWRCRSLLDAGVAVRAGTDAPYGTADPWVCMAAAIERRTPIGAAVGGDKGLAPLGALGLFRNFELVRSRAIEVGDPADLCLLDRPIHEALASPSAGFVRATLVGGNVIHETGAR